MVLLGALLDAEAGCIRTPELKRKWILHAVEELRSSLATFATVPRRLVERFTGRLVNISQYFPVLKILRWLWVTRSQVARGSWLLAT